MPHSWPAQEIRSLFLKYFEKNGHTQVPSSSLVPQNDPTLLFTNAGMNQFKDVFLGKETRPYRRATSSQKCVRAGGKHNDLENVGFTARHHTFFEMLGNFSFGDYFKKEAIHYAWEFVTRDLALPKDRLYVTVYKEDAEAADLWHSQEKVPTDRISRFGEKDNFWSMGDSGPCGPCTEIFVDRGKDQGCRKPTCAVGCECDRFMEIWNLVFMQYNRTADGKMAPLPKPSVDTGAGLERVASVLQNVSSNYGTDLFQDLIGGISSIAGVPYRKQSDIAPSFHVIADHARATAFLMADGVLPSNEGRGYVLRRIMRRAIRHGKKIGAKDVFFDRACAEVIRLMSNHYPELQRSRDLIAKAVRSEEELFMRTLERGLGLLDEETRGISRGGRLSGSIAFKLYDTFGFPLDLTRVICEERGIGVDEAGFETAMDSQRAESKKNWKGSGDTAISTDFARVAEELKARGKLPRFIGYNALSTESECVWSGPGGKAGEALAVFLETPFYAEGGGQVGDRGQIEGAGVLAQVIDCTRPAEGLWVARAKISQGEIKVGSRYRLTTDRWARGLTARNHTATHMLQWALRKVLGEHVKQAGSLVSPELLRFDFSHFSPMTTEELRKVEDLLNERIFFGHPVAHQEMKKEDALAAGAIAMFGEKYGERVRVIQVGDFSVELCGGTHVQNSSEINLFKIVSESGIAAGVRRIIAYTSDGAYRYLREQDDRLRAVRDRLGASSVDEIPAKIERLQNSEKDLRKQLEKAAAQSAAGLADELLKNATLVGGAQVVVGQAPASADGIKALRELADQIKQRAPEAWVILACSDPEGTKAFLLSAKGAKAPAAANAQALVAKLAPLIEGRGGGKPDLAQAGGTKSAGIAALIEAAPAEAARILGASS